MRKHRPPRVISLHKDGITLGDPSTERERERDLLSQKGKPREARLLEFTRFDACLRVSPGFRQRALEDISAWVGRVYPAQAKSVGRPRSIGGGAESSRFVGRSRSIVTVRRYSTFFVVVVSIEALTNERNARGELSSMPRHMYRGQRARRILLRGRDPRWRRKTVLPRHEDGKRERKTIAIYARM